MIQTQKIDSANSIIKATIENQELEATKDKVARKIAKEANVPGFRKGKLPAKALERKVKAVKKLYAQDIEREAISELVRDVLNEGIKELGDVEVIGEPEVSKFEKKEDKIEVEIKVYTKPEINIGDDYKECVPEVELPEVTEEEIQKELEEIAKSFSTTKVVTDRDTVQKGDIAVISFKGYVDGKEMENGSAEDYPLELGSGAFVPGFEEQIEGMKVGESKKIKVTFPENYAKELAGKEAEFEVTLQEIQEKKPAEINDELAKKYLNKEDATLDELKNYVKEAILNRKKAEVFKPKKEEILECLVKKYDIDVPEGIVEKEIDVMVNQEASKLTPAEIKELQENSEKLQEFRNKFKDEAKDRVKLTFIVDELAKKEGISVSDEEITQVLFYEALMQGQNPQELIKYYQENNLLPVLKMNLAEEKLLNKLLEEKAKGK